MKYVAYYRVSTSKQGQSGLGMEAQQAAVARHIVGCGGERVGSFQEVESGRKSDRIELAKAIEAARQNRATLIVAKLDRLSRDPEFLFKLQNSGLDFVCCDMPQADKFTIGIMIVMAQKERDDTSRRTKAALAVRKAELARAGKRLGAPDKSLVKSRTKAAEVIQAGKLRHAAYVMKVIAELREAHVTTLSEMAKCLNRRGIPTARNGKWTATAVRRVIAATATE
jgi:DNA invertase Pin-like site-specific DNA recombinase